MKMELRQDEKSDELLRQLHDLINQEPEERPISRPRWLVLFWLCGLVGAGIGGWYLLKPAPTVEVYQLRQADLVSRLAVLYASGYVVARRAATVSSKITARIEEVLIEEGDQVKKGQILARLDDSNIRRELELAQARAEEIRRQLDEARVRLKLAEKELERTTQLYQDGVVSSSQLDAAQAERDTWICKVATLEQSLEVAQKEVAVWEQQLEDTLIRAPFDGVVTTKDAHPGEIVSPVTAGGGYTRTGICTIVDMGSLEIEVDVNEEFVSRIYKGQPVIGWFDAYPGWQIRCHVIAIVPTANRDKATVRVRIGFESLDPRILPEMSIRLAFLRDEENDSGALFYVPRAAVHEEGQARFLWVVTGGRLEKRTVEVIVDQGAELGVKGQLGEGELVVIKAQRALREGERVRIAH